MRGIQYSDFVEVFNCLTALANNVGANDCTYSTESALWKSCLPLLFRRSGTSAYNYLIAFSANEIMLRQDYEKN